MRRLAGTHVGDLVIDEDTVIEGLVDGSVHVQEGRLLVQGAVRHDVVVDGPSAAAEIQGAVAGTVQVIRGTARIFGAAFDAVATGEGVLMVAPGATIGKDAG